MMPWKVNIEQDKGRKQRKLKQGENMRFEREQEERKKRENEK